MYEHVYACACAFVCVVYKARDRSCRVVALKKKTTDDRMSRTRSTSALIRHFFSVFFFFTFIIIDNASERKESMYLLKPGR